jgi:hypothetical protein
MIVIAILLLAVFGMVGGSPGFHFASADSSLVQQNSNSNTCQPTDLTCSVSVTLPGNVKTGDVLVTALTDLGGCYVCANTVTDTLGTSFTLADFAVCSSCGYPIFIYVGTVLGPGGASDTVTFTDVSGASSAASATVLDVSGVTTVLKQTATGTGSCSINPCDMETSSSAFVPGAFLVAIAATDSGSGTYSTGSGFTQAGSTLTLDSGVVLSAVQYAQSSSSGPPSPTNFPISISSSSGDWDEAGIALQPLGVTTTVTQTVTKTDIVTATLTTTTTQIQTGISTRCSPSTTLEYVRTYCTALASAGLPPDGTISFTNSGGTGTFSNFKCATPQGNTLSCSVFYTPRSGGTQTITATFNSADPHYTSASASTNIKILSLGPDSKASSVSNSWMGPLIAIAQSVASIPLASLLSMLALLVPGAFVFTISRLGTRLTSRKRI